MCVCTTYAYGLAFALAWLSTSTKSARIERCRRLLLRLLCWRATNTRHKYVVVVLFAKCVGHPCWGACALVGAACATHATHREATQLCRICVKPIRKSLSASLKRALRARFGSRVGFVDSIFDFRTKCTQQIRPTLPLLLCSFFDEASRQHQHENDGEKTKKHCRNADSMFAKKNKSRATPSTCAQCPPVRSIMA